MIDYTALQGFDISDKRAAVLGVGGPRLQYCRAPCLRRDRGADLMRF